MIEWITEHWGWTLTGGGIAGAILVFWRRIKSILFPKKYATKATMKIESDSNHRNY